MIDEKEVTAYVTIPDCFLQGCSEDIVIFRADGGNHFTDYGIYEGMFLFFDRKKRFKKGRLSCYINTAGDDRPKYRVSDKNIDGWIYNTDRTGDVRCLCPKCLSDYIHDPNYVVRRLDPFAKSKDHCDKCNNSGWDYIVYDKRTSVKGKGCRNE